MASLTIPYNDFVAGTSIVSQQTDDNNAAILNYINARNSAATAWDAVKATGQILSGAGTAPAPGLAVGDAANGIYRSAANEVSIVTGGTQGLIISSAQDVYNVPFTDYSGTSTVIGWTSFNTKSIFYKKIGKLVFVWFVIDGTSNATNATFTLPYQNNGLAIDLLTLAYDVGTAGTGRLQLPISSSTLAFFKSSAAAAFTNSGNKIVNGSFVYSN